MLTKYTRPRPARGGNNLVGGEGQKMSINDGLVVVFEERKSGQIKSWETPKTQKGNYIFITQHILIQFIKRAEYASRSPFLSKKRYKVTIKLEMCDTSPEIARFTSDRQGREKRTSEKGTRTIAKVTKVGDIQSEDQGWLFSVIYILDELQKLAAACVRVTYLQHSFVFNLENYTAFLRGASHSLLSIFSFFTEDNGENRISPVALYYDGLPSS